jgi:hypothetical protein
MCRRMRAVLARAPLRAFLVASPSCFTPLSCWEPYVFHADAASSAAGRAGSCEGMSCIIIDTKKTEFLLLGLTIILVFF